MPPECNGNTDLELSMWQSKWLSAVRNRIDPINRRGLIKAPQPLGKRSTLTERFDEVFQTLLSTTSFCAENFQYYPLRLKYEVRIK